MPPEVRVHSDHSVLVRRQVLVQWQEVVSVQIYCRQQEDCAVREARRVLDRGKWVLEAEERVGKDRGPFALPLSQSLCCLLVR